MAGFLSGQLALGGILTSPALVFGRNENAFAPSDTRASLYSAYEAILLHSGAHDMPPRTEYNRLPKQVRVSGVKEGIIPFQKPISS